MRGINIAKPARLPSSVEECAKDYLENVAANRSSSIETGLLLIGYMAWPNDEKLRNEWMATRLIVREAREQANRGASVGTDPEQFGGLDALAEAASSELSRRLTVQAEKWFAVADVFQVLVDLAYDDRVEEKASISSAKALCEIARGTLRRSQQSRAWSEFRDVAHLITAAAHLAHRGQVADPGTDAESPINVVLHTPYAVVALAAGYQQFGLDFKPYRQKDTVLPPNTAWRIPDELFPEWPYIVKRSLSPKQVEFIQTRRVPNPYRKAG